MTLPDRHVQQPRSRRQAPPTFRLCRTSTGVLLINDSVKKLCRSRTSSLTCPRTRTAQSAPERSSTASRLAAATPSWTRSLLPRTLAIWSRSDHLIVGRSKVTHGLGNERVALFMWDRATGMKDAPALKSKAAKGTELAIKTFAGGSVKSLYSDNAPELVKAAEGLGIVHLTSTPHRPQSNSLTERQVRGDGRRHQGCPRAVRTSTPLLASRVAHNTMAENVERKGDDGRTAWERHHGESFTGLRIPFGAAVAFRPWRKPVGKFDDRAVDGLFVGWFLHPEWCTRATSWW